MPPRDKPQPSPELIKLLAWWIDQGADPQARPGDLKIPADLSPLLAARETLRPRSHADIQAALHTGAVPAAFTVRFVSLKGAGLTITSSRATDADVERLLAVRENLTHLDLSRSPVTDAILAVSGRLNPQLFGTSVILPIPSEAIITLSGTPYPTGIPDNAWVHRRSVYAYNKRTVPIPLIQLFDGADLSASCGQRTTTTVPTQALLLMNNDAVLVRSADLAARITREAPETLETKLSRAFALALSRPPTAAEAEALGRFYETQLALRAGHHQRTLTDLCQVIFNLNEFIYVN